MSRRWAVVSLTGLIAHVVLLVSLHVLDQRFSPVEDPISLYANGDFGLLVALALFSLGIGGAALTIALYSVLFPPARSWIGLILMMVFSVGIFAAGIFPVDPTETTTTSSGTAHDWTSGIAIWAGLIGMLLVVIRVRRDKRHVRYFRVALALIVASWIATFVWVAVFEEALDAGGLGQRIYLAVFLSLLIYSAAYGLRLSRVHIESSEAAFDSP